MKGGKPDPQSNARANNKLNSHMVPGRARLVGGECSHHYVIPAPQGMGLIRILQSFSPVRAALCHLLDIIPEQVQLKIKEFGLKPWLESFCCSRERRFYFHSASPHPGLSMGTCKCNSGERRTRGRVGSVQAHFPKQQVLVKPTEMI